MIWHRFLSAFCSSLGQLSDALERMSVHTGWVEAVDAIEKTNALEERIKDRADVWEVVRLKLKDEINGCVDAVLRLNVEAMLR